jgi:hypothetical protein
MLVVPREFVSSTGGCGGHGGFWSPEVVNPSEKTRKARASKYLSPVSMLRRRGSAYCNTASGMIHKYRYIISVLCYHSLHGTQPGLS